MIAYLQLPANQTIADQFDFFRQLQGVASWEIDGRSGMYLQLEPWVKRRVTHYLYQALRNYFGARIRFGAAGQKTTARAAALYRSVPHCMIVTSESTDQFLSQLPIQLLPGLGQRTTRFLEQRGVKTFSTFRGLSAGTLKEWFGVSGLILQQFARGLDPRVVEPQRV